MRHRLHRTASTTLTATAAMVLIAAQGPAAAPVAAQPATCNDPSCVPAIAGGVTPGAPCANTTYFVFGTTSWGRLVFCGSPRRYGPRYFRSPPMQGVKDEHSLCEGYMNAVAQAPDGLFLTCAAVDGATRWVRGDA